MKKYLSGFLAIVLAVSLSAFTTSTPKPNTLSLQWFTFNGDPGDEADPSMYAPISSPICTSTTAAYQCEIYAEPQTGNPSLPNLNTVQQVLKKANP